MRTSQAGIDLIKSFEGLRLVAYQCSAGVWTIGYGSTHGVQEGDTITEEEAEDLLRLDLFDAEDCVNQMVLVPLTQSQFDSLVSFVFNVGCAAFSRSTLLQLIEVGDMEGAAKQFARWNKAKGKVLAGLTRRRAAEREMFEA